MDIVDSGKENIYLFKRCFLTSSEYSRLHSKKMSFINIEDPIKRERVVQDYAKLLKEVKNKYLDKKENQIHTYKTLEKTFAPIIKSQQNMSKEIVKHLTKENDFVVENIKKEEEADEKHLGNLPAEYRRRYLMKDEEIDTQFGIRYLEDGQAVIGNTPIKFYGNDIIIGDEMYKGTSGVWTLLTEKRKENLHSYTDQDAIEYMYILNVTNVLHKNFDASSNYPRSNSSYKWKTILSAIWRKLREDKEEEQEEEEEDEEEDEEQEES